MLCQKTVALENTKRQLKTAEDSHQHSEAALTRKAAALKNAKERLQESKLALGKQAKELQDTRGRLQRVNSKFREAETSLTEKSDQHY